jgi:protein SCO1/2
MKLFRILFLFVLIVFIQSCRNSQEGECCQEGTVSDSTQKVSGESVYLIPGTFITENNLPLELKDLKGKVQVVSMIFSHCEYACPRLISDMKNIESKIPADKRDQVGFLVVSFDVKRDSPERLKEFKTLEQLGNNWTLLHGDEHMVRMFSVMMNMKYEKQSDGNFAHSNVIAVLDKSGVMHSNVEGLGADPSPTLATIHNLLD